MWYLNIYVLFALLGLTIFIAMGDKLDLFSKSILGFNLRSIILLLFSAGFLFIIDFRLAAFYIPYTVIIYLISRLLIRIRDALKKVVFPAGIIVALLPILFFRLSGLLSLKVSSAAVVITIGLIYNMLKAINVLYMAYFAGIEIKALYYFNFMFFIPTFTSGPILRYRDFIRDLEKPSKLTSKNAETGIKRIIFGLFKKIVLVQILTELYNHILEGNMDCKSSVLILIVYYVLLYFDFSGYTDVAIGFGLLLGFKIPENFKKPFSSPTMTQFWRNWHATLGDWFREHIFVFMVKKNVGRLLGAVASFIIMVIIGFWHGFQPLLILWGVYHGIILFLENILNLTTFKRKGKNTAVFYLRCIAVNALVAFGTIFFSSNIETALKILKGFLKV